MMPDHRCLNTFHVTKPTEIQVLKFPLIDEHKHLGDEFGWGWIHHPINELTGSLNEACIRIFTDLNEGGGKILFSFTLLN